MPSNGSTEASMLAHLSWAKTRDRAARTAPARRGLEARFEREVDPELTMSPDDRAKAVESYRKAYFRRLALASAEARRAKQDAA
ncbi:hypothetical protein GCM10009613_11550 [Pseudonocardia kongjuensis]|uniref:Uncharacterized protein n=1 Tax=Pseudonocardia kongjuensis TaxID=102227 RepID=A0ABP4I6J9_9PSEU